MRVFFIFIGLLYSIPCMADIVAATTCGQYDGDQNSCTATAGCKYNAGLCTRCGSGTYCPANSTPQNCPSNFPHSPEGATDMIDCYKPTNNPGGGCYKIDGTTNSNCGLFYDGGTFGGGSGISKCWDNNGYSTQQYHMEYQGAVGICYANIRACNLFSKNAFFYGLQSANTCGSAIGLANWTGSRWDVSSCQFSPNQDGCELTELGCKANDFSLKPKNEGYVPDATHPIQYDAQVGPKTQYYHCNSCIDGYYVNTGGNNTDYQECSHGTCPFSNCKHFTTQQGFYVCRCSPVPKGYWLNSANCTWDNISVSHLRCQPNDCPAGKTTLYTATVDSGDCVYTDQTKFCDAKGCFTLSDIGNWDGD